MKVARVEVGIIMDIYLGERYEYEELARHLAEQIAIGAISFKDEPGVSVANVVATTIEYGEV